jgi:hypothetical protein
MTVKELQKMAKGLGIKTTGLRKAELVKAIQKAEGNFDCFGTATDNCDQANCLFLQDCLG